MQESVTPFHAAATAESWLRAAGFTRLEEADYWNLEPGKGYYTTRNGSSVVAWRVPDHAIGGWRIVASHSDSPTWKIKTDIVENDGCRRLSVEGYGGMIMSTWLDRPLTVGGRVIVKTEDGIESRLVCIDRDFLVIPSLAIHFQRDINKGHTFNPQVDMQPLWARRQPHPDRPGGGGTGRGHCGHPGQRFAACDPPGPDPDWPRR